MFLLLLCAKVVTAAARAHVGLFCQDLEPYEQLFLGAHTKVRNSRTTRYGEKVVKESEEREEEKSWG